ncbi:hypothetical protein ACFQ0G_46090 [Streptomyces chiangmaiensis]|uniref:hypothetical protein n=1 Tax=Streptomyces chiangmaiensis TaxID=766497 RepID=UPI0031EDCD90
MQDVDPLADIVHVIGQYARVLTREVLQRLAELNPVVYKMWNNSDLREFLEGFDAAPHKSDGKMVVDRQKVRDALARRDAA